MSAIRLLLADPNPLFRDACGTVLFQQGYQVTPAASSEETRTFLKESWFHLVILNIHLCHTQDLEDTSGLDILRDAAFQAVPKIAIADEPTVAMIREVLRPGPNGPMAVDFLGKETDLSPLLHAVQDALNKHIRLNNALKIRQQDTASFLQLAQLLGLSLSHQQLADRADELESLFRTAFVDAHQLILERLLAHRAGYVLLEVTIYTGTFQTLLVSCSEVGQAAIGQTVPENVALVKCLSSHSTIHFVLQIYQIGFVRPLRTFREFYSVSSNEKVVSLIQRFTSHTLARWHKSHRGFEAPEHIETLLQARLKPDMSALAAAITGVCEQAHTHGIAHITHSPHKLILHLPDGQNITTPNPFTVVGRSSLKQSTASLLCGLTHGALSGSNILFDDNEQSWLMDWHRVETGPVLLDYVHLEMVIRQEGLANTELIHVVHLEQLLNDHKSESHHELPSQLTKLLTALTTVRQASRVDETAYKIGLFYGALNYLTGYQSQVVYTPSELLSFVQMLLLAVLLSETLVVPLALPTQALESLWINVKTDDVWVEGKQVELTSQDLAILLYLYRNAGQRRSREQIIDEALGQQTDDVIIEESRLNSAMSRLRLKIEPDPEKPKYLHTIRGFGYRLDV